MREPRTSPWQLDRRDYDAICAYLELTPRASLYERLRAHLAGAAARGPVPDPFSRYLGERPLTRWSIARLDLATRLVRPAHPLRHALNGVIALHECDGEGFREMDAAPRGLRAALLVAGGLLAFALNLALTLPWLAWQRLGFAVRTSASRGARLAGRRVLVTGVARGLGRDLLLHCVGQGAEVIGTVRSGESRAALAAALPPGAKVTLLVADLSAPGTLAAALDGASVAPQSIDVAVACAGVKHDGASALSLAELRDTFQVNLFAAAELARWLCSDEAAAPGPPRTTALALVSSMGRWHGMHFSCGYNASKAALSIWGESLEMELAVRRNRRFTVTVVEPGIFASGMTRPGPLGRLLLVPRERVAERVVAAALAGRRSVRPPVWFALLTWATCCAGRGFRARLFARARPRTEQR